jgi:hypothetical protein
MRTIQFGRGAVPYWHSWGYLQQPGALPILVVAMDIVLDIVLGIIMVVAVTTAETPIVEALRGEVAVANSGKAEFCTHTAQLVSYISEDTSEFVLA